MSAALPRSKKNKFAQPISHSSEESKKKKNHFVGTGISPKCKGTRSKGRQEEEAVQAHPWGGALENLLRPLPADMRYNIQRFFGGVGSFIANILPNQNNQGQIRVGRRGF
eukprot:jgi/Picsp_1/4862/NSC_02227-R1_---NA---